VRGVVLDVDDGVFVVPGIGERRHYFSLSGRNFFLGRLDVVVEDDDGQVALLRPILFLRLFRHPSSLAQRAGGGTEEEHLTTDPPGEGLNTTTARLQEKMEKSFDFLFRISIHSKTETFRNKGRSFDFTFDMPTLKS